MLILLILIILNQYLCIHIKSSCGHPGLPPDGSIFAVDPDRNRFNDGDSIGYQCSSDFHTHKQTRTCKSGRWYGQTARCGVPIENDIQSVEVFDCSQSENKANHRKILDIKINQTDNPLRLTNSFHASRIKSGPIEVNGSLCYLWKINLNRPSMVAFLAIDIATSIKEVDMDTNSSTLSTELFTLVPFVSPYRVCRSIQEENFLENDHDTNSTFLLRGLYFRCDVISENDYLIESKKESQQIMVEIRTTTERDIHLVALFLAKHKLNPKNGRPDCGKPEMVNTGVNYREVFKTGISQFQFLCNDSFIDVTLNKPFDRKPDYWYTMKCSIKGLWEGQFPLCIPKIQCPGLEYLKQHKEQSVDIESIENVYYVNESYWVAGEHSQVYFTCKNPDHIMVGKPAINCHKNGVWGNPMPKCTGYVKPESLSTVTQSPWTVIAILTFLLLSFLSMVLLIVRKYVANMRKELMRYRNKSRQQTSIYTDIKSNSINYIYDDCDATRLSTRFNARINRMTKKGLHIHKYDTEYIELEATDSRDNNNASTEPLYIPILPPTQ